MIRICANTHSTMNNCLARNNKQRAFVVITLRNIDSLNAQGWLYETMDSAIHSIVIFYPVKRFCAFSENFVRRPRFPQKWKMRTWREMSVACPPVRCPQAVSAVRQVSANWRRRFCTLSLVSKRIKRRQATRILPERLDDPAYCIVKHSLLKKNRRN